MDPWLPKITKNNSTILNKNIISSNVKKTNLSWSITNVLHAQNHNKNSASLKKNALISVQTVLSSWNWIIIVSIPKRQYLFLKVWITLMVLKIHTFGVPLHNNSTKTKFNNLKTTTFLFLNVLLTSLSIKTAKNVLHVHLDKYLMLAQSNAPIVKINKNTFKKHTNANKFIKSQTTMRERIGSQ